MTGHKDAEAAVTVRLDTIRRGYTRAIHWLLFVERNCAASASGNPPASRPTDAASLILPKRLFKSSIRRLDSNLTKYVHCLHRWLCSLHCKYVHCLYVNRWLVSIRLFFILRRPPLLGRTRKSWQSKTHDKFLNVHQLLQYSSGSQFDFTTNEP